MKITRHIFETYLSMIKGSEGTHMFRHFWADFDGTKQDTMQDGWKSCAFYVSSLLSIFNVIDGPHSTVRSTVEALEKAGWQSVHAPYRPGDVVVWEPMRPTPEDELIDHIGFYIGEEKAISTSWRLKTPVLHDYLFRDTEERKIVSAYRGDHLMPDNIKNTED